MLKRHCNLENGDRISSLPESIIRHILSFLPTEDAVSTSTLSTRWKDLWTSVTTLDFDDGIRANRATKYQQRLANDFMNSVERVLLLRGVHSTIKKFHLRLGNPKYDAFRVTSWICATTKQNVEEISLGIDQGLDFELPLRLLNCEKLMVLKLSGKISLKDINFSVCLKHLKVLHFLHLQNLHDAGVSKLIDGSPVLEELVIEKAGKKSAESLHLQSPSLKRLTISYEGDVESIVVDAPQLEFIKLSEKTPKVLKMIQSSSLVEADIQVGWSGMREEVLDDYFHAAAQLLRQMSNIEILHFSIPQQLEKPFKSFSIKLGTFHNLIRLELRGFVLGTGVLPLMLKDSPKLKVIILHEMYSLNSTYVRALGEDVLRMWYMSCCLEVAELKGFTWKEAEMEIVKFLLKIAKRLKKMVISFDRYDYSYSYSFSYSSKGLPAALNELLSFPRASGIFQLPWSLLHCDKLVVMKLSGEFSLGRHSFHNVLETLKVFHLHQVQDLHAAAVTIED